MNRRPLLKIEAPDERHARSSRARRLNSDDYFQRYARDLRRATPELGRDPSVFEPLAPPIASPEDD